MIAAILKAQFLSMRLRSGVRRGATVFSALTALLFYALWLALAWTAMLFFSLRGEQPHFLPVLSAGLMFVMLYWQLSPVLSASFGASLDLRKLLAYPIPHDRLFVAELVLRLSTCAEMLLLVAGVMAGLLRNPAFGRFASVRILFGGGLFIAMNVLLSAGARNWLERLFLRSRMREALMFLLVFATLIPQFLLLTRPVRQHPTLAAPAQAFWPWGTFARLMLGDANLLLFPAALVFVAAAALFSRWQFERSLRSDGTGGVRVASGVNRFDSFADAVFRFPSRLLPDPLGALVEKEIRTLVRIPRFRLVYVMSCCFGLALYLPSLLRTRARDSFLFENMLPLMSLYGLLMLGQISYWNCFGFDRGSAQGYFSWPVRFRDVLLAKNLAVLAFVLPQIFLISGVSLAARLPVSVGKVLETVIVMPIACGYWFSLGNIASVRIPRRIDPEKMNQMSNRMQALTILAAPFLLLPLALAYWARWFFGSQLVFAGLLVIAAIVSAIFYGVGLDSAVETAQASRESLLQELAISDGPVSVMDPKTWTKNWPCLR